MVEYEHLETLLQAQKFNIDLGQPRDGVSKNRNHPFFQGPADLCEMI